MRVLLLGATGRTGRALLDLALERGHTVTALVISPEKLITRSAQLVVMAGDPCDQESVTAAVRGSFRTQFERQHFGGQRNRFADAYRAATGVKCVRTQSHRPSTFRYTSVTHSSALIRCPLK